MTSLISSTVLISHADNPSLDCGDRDVCPGPSYDFECETRGSSSLAWMSDEYIGSGGADLQFIHSSPVGTMKKSALHPNVFAILTANKLENGVRVLNCVLNISLPSDMNVSAIVGHRQSVTCVNRGLSRSTTANLRITGMY